MGTTISEVATRAGVSPATVSRALRGLPNVAPATRERVLAAAAELHYVPDPHAARLAGGRTATVGLVVPFVGRWYYAQLTAGIEAVCTAAGYDLLLYSLRNPTARRRFLEELPYRRLVDGLIVADVPMRPSDLGAIAATDVTLVTVGLADPRFPSITIDEVAAARTATTHLINLGHERIGLIGEDPEGGFEFRATRLRRDGWCGALREHGLAHDPDLERSGRFSFEGGAEAMAALLAASAPPTAVFALSDEMAVGALHVARELGLEVPGDLSVVGFDDHEVARLLELTTIRQPVARIGESAAVRLLELIAGDAAPLEQVLATQLVVRDTSGPSPRRSTHRRRSGSRVGT